MSIRHLFLSTNTCLGQDRNCHHKLALFTRSSIVKSTPSVLSYKKMCSLVLSINLRNKKTLAGLWRRRKVLFSYFFTLVLLSAISHSNFSHFLTTLNQLMNWVSEILIINQCEHFWSNLWKINYQQHFFCLQYFV